MSRFAFIGVLAFCIGSVSCFGDLGHRTTAAIAENYLNKNAVEGIRRIFENYRGPNRQRFQSILRMSTYADDIKGIIPWAAAYHYINMDDDEITFDQDKQCLLPRSCVVGSLQNYTDNLRNPSVRDVDLLGESLYFVIHLMGDIFQPLHAGNTDDLGGNRITMKFANEWKIDTTSSNLHWCWDHLLLLHWMNTEGLAERDVYVEFKKFIEADTAFRDKYLTKVKDSYVGIVEDTREVVVQIYADLNNYNLSNVPIVYFTKYWPVFKTQMMKSGLQMARVLNDIFDDRFSNSAARVYSGLVYFVIGFSLKNLFRI